MSQQNYLLSVPGMSCSGCAAGIKAAAFSVGGVDSAIVDLTNRTVKITGDASLDELVDAISAAGYKANEINLTTE